jgi:hypothetical protein
MRRCCKTINKDSTQKQISIFSTKIRILLLSMKRKNFWSNLYCLKFGGVTSKYRLVVVVVVVAICSSLAYKKIIKVSC